MVDSCANFEATRVSAVVAGLLDDLRRLRRTAEEDVLSHIRCTVKSPTSLSRRERDDYHLREAKGSVRRAMLCSELQTELWSL